MTAADLITELQKLPPDLRVMVHGYEGGYADCPTPETRKVALDVNTAWYYGPHDDPDNNEGATVIEAAII